MVATRQYEGKHKRKLSNMEVVEPEKDTGDWKRPWMLTKVPSPRPMTESSFPGAGTLLVRNPGLPPPTHDKV